MTSPSPRKPPTTARARTTRAATLTSALAAAWLLAGAAHGQQPAGSPYHVRPVVSSSTPTAARWTATASGPAQTPFLPVPSPVVPVKYQRGDAPTGDEPRREYQIQLEPPGLERISRLDSDARLQERIRQETKYQDPTEVVLFPEEPILSRDTYRGRGALWDRRTMFVEPNYCCFGRLYFQDLNAERYGWDLGPIHPLVCTAKYLYDLALLPAHFAVDPCGNDCNAGYCLPGDPTPLLLYPPELTVRGSVVEAAVILALVAIFP
ncbi:MAG: hypothetical protein U0797_02540 [Gemmataceae bacterium]